MGVIALERIIDQAKDDIAFSQKLYVELKMGVGSRFRVKDLPKTISHSGSVFNHFVNVGLLKVVEKKKEKIVIANTNRNKISHDYKVVYVEISTMKLFDTLSFNQNANDFVRQTILVPRKNAETIEIESEYNIYEVALDVYDFYNKRKSELKKLIQTEILQIARSYNYALNSLLKVEDVVNYNLR